MGTRLSTAARVCIALCGVVTLLAVFDDARTLGTTPPLFSFRSHRLPVALASALYLLHVLRHREAVLARCARLAGGRLEGGDRRAVRRFLGLTLVAGFLLRVAHTGALAFSADEAQLVWVASARDLGEMWQIITTASPHPPGCFALLHALGQLSWEPFWLRLPSVVAGTATIGLAHLVGRELLGRLEGLALALLVCLSPPLIELSRTARNYSVPLALLLLAVFLLARGLRTRSSRDLAIASLLAPLVLLFHYVFAVALAGLGLAAAGTLLLGRAPLRDWLRLGLFQLPLLAVASLLYTRHVSALPADLGEAHRIVYDDMLEVGSSSLFGPFLQIWFLLAGRLGLLLLAPLSLLGMLWLLLRRNLRGLLFCAGPLVAGYAFGWLGILPFGGTRHSAYVFPFLLGLVAVNVREALLGFESLRSRGWAFAGAAPRPGAWGLAAVAGLAFLLVNGASLAYERYHAPGVCCMKQLPIGYRQQDLRASFRILEQRVGPRDLVVMTPGGRLQFLVEQQVRAPAGGSAAPAAVRDEDGVLGVGPVRYERRGVAYHYVAMGRQSGPAVIQAVERIRAHFGRVLVRRVWILRGAWDERLEKVLGEYCPELRGDAEVAEASHGILFVVDAADLRACRLRNVAGDGA